MAGVAALGEHLVVRLANRHLAVWEEGRSHIIQWLCHDEWDYNLVLLYPDKRASNHRIRCNNPDTSCLHRASCANCGKAPEISTALDTIQFTFTLSVFGGYKQA